MTLIAIIIFENNMEVLSYFSWQIAIVFMEFIKFWLSQTIISVEK